MIVVPPSSSPVMSAHKRTPSEADRWLDEVSKSVRAPQPSPITVGATPPSQPFAAPVPMSSVGPAPVAPVAFMPAAPPAVTMLPPAVPMLPPRQPAFHAAAPASFPVSNGLPVPASSVPVFGITPSQMVANVFGSAVQPQPFPVAVSTTTPQHDGVGPFIKPPQPAAAAPNGSITFNGADGWATPSSPSTRPAPQPQEDAFEAQWAALEGRSRQRTTPSPTNPFSTELQKTFEIQL